MKTDKHKLQAALVRSFFDAFSSGVIDCGQGSVQERRQPQNVKRAMLDYYEQIASFRQASLYRLLLDAMNVLLHDEKLDYSDCGESITAMLVKACGSEQRFAVATAEMDRAQQDIMG